MISGEREESSTLQRPDAHRHVTIAVTGQYIGGEPVVQKQAVASWYGYCIDATATATSSSVSVSE